LRFDWDVNKAKSNLAKHGTSFEEAEDVFSPGSMFRDDLDHSETEFRFLAIGFSAKGRLLTVSFARLDAETYRIISARRATKLEQRKYAEEKRKNG